MSMVLNGSSQYGYCNGVNLVYPFTISCWFKSDSVVVSQIIASLEVAVSYDYNVLQASGAIAGDPIRAMTYNTAWKLAGTSTGYAAGTWYNAVGVFYSATDRRVYLNGAGKGTNTDSQTASGTNLGVGIYKLAAPDGWFDGKLSDLGIWDIALSDADALTLAGGAPPTDVEVADLVHYYPLLSDGNDDVGTSHLTLVGTPTWDGDDLPPVLTYIDMAGTLDGAGEIAGELEVVAFEDLEGTLAGTGSMTGGLLVTIADTYCTRQWLVAVGTDELWYEDL